jgi:hypothetical protein
MGKSQRNKPRDEDSLGPAKDRRDYRRAERHSIKDLIRDYLKGDLGPRPSRPPSEGAEGHD